VAGWLLITGLALPQSLHISTVCILACICKVYAHCTVCKAKGSTGPLFLGAPFLIKKCMKHLTNGVSRINFWF
jgi:hypothetical protein